MPIAIIPTARMEWEGLPEALRRLFPGVEFYCLPTQEERLSHPEDFPIPGFTSNRLQPPDPAAGPGDLDNLVRRAAMEALGDRDTEAADMVVILDDLELANADQPDIVVSCVEAAVRRHIESLSFNQRFRSRTAAALKERVSFHLAVPMTESWFFADPAGLVNARVPADRLPARVVPDRDPECFQTDDVDYRDNDASPCAYWRSLPRDRQKRHTPLWVKTSQREAHPKAYLSWLCRDPREANCSAYQETDGGVAALERLDWDAVLANLAHMPFLRALVADIAEHLDGDPPCLGGGGREAPLTSRHQIPRNHVLRNL